MRRFASLPLLSRALPAIVAIVLAGCHACQKVEFDACCQVSFERVELHYELDGYRGGYWSRALSLLPRAPGEMLPNEMPDASKGVTCQRAEIHILCPHPERGPEMARAVIRLWHQGRPMVITPPKMPVGRKVAVFYSKVDGRRRYLPEPLVELKDGQCDPMTIRSAPETYTLDCSRWEIEMILSDLVCSGFFDSQNRPNGGTHLIAEVDGKRVCREWTPEPRLDDLLTRVSVDGRRLRIDEVDPSLEPKPVRVVPGDSEPGRIRLDGDSEKLPVPPEPSPAQGSKPVKPDRTNSADEGVLPERPKLPAGPPELMPTETPMFEPDELEPSVPPFEESPPDDVLPPPLKTSFTEPSNDDD